MPFAARKHDDDTWRLCKRMGPTILEAVFSDRTRPIGPFPSQAKTKACADELNTRWPDYAKAVKTNDMPDELATWMLQTVADHDGLPESPKARTLESANA